MNDIHKTYHRVTDDAIYGFFEDYRWLSNFHDCSVEYDGLIYPSSENAYQAAKSLDQTVRRQFVMMSPGRAKRHGGDLDLRPDWEAVKEVVMGKIVFNKFLRSMELGEKLIATGKKFLEETNHWGDNIWGRDYRSDVGGNKLGQILMATRNSLRLITYDD